MKTFLERGTLQQAERILADHISELPLLPPLGEQFKELHGCDLADALVVHRIKSQFSTFDTSNSKMLEQVGVAKMLEYDQSYTGIDWRTLDRDDRATFIGAQEFLKRVLRGYKPSYIARFPKNETFVSNKGDTSLETKLGDLNQWAVSADCIPYAIRIAWNNLWLKKLVKIHFRAKHTDWRFKQAIVARECPIGKHVGFYVFERMFRDLVTICGVSRVTSVAKNATSRRIITCEPLWNMVVQLSIAADLRDLLKRNFGVDIRQLANFHRIFIMRGDATIDKRNASNSNWWDVVQDLFPRRVVDNLHAARTGIVEYDGQFYPLNMMAPMGCGFTFEVMTLTLLAYAQQFCKRATVFGDDVIISPEKADAYVSFVEKMGWVINDQKSFVDGNFRESCGGFYDLSGDRYLHSYDFPPLETHMDLIVTLNKLRCIWVAGQVSAWLKGWLVSTWISLFKLVPDALAAWPKQGLQGGTVDYRPLHVHRRRKLREILIGQQLQRCAELRHIELFTHQRRAPTKVGSVVPVAHLAACMFSNRLSEPKLKENRIKYRWVDSTGSSCESLTLWSPIG